MVTTSERPLPWTPWRVWRCRTRWLPKRSVPRSAEVLVIGNTVRAAVATQTALEALEGAGAYFFRVGSVATLHHGRFAPEDRRALDSGMATRTDPSSTVAWQ